MVIIVTSLLGLLKIMYHEYNPEYNIQLVSTESILIYCNCPTGHCHIDTNNIHEVLSVLKIFWQHFKCQPPLSLKHIL